MEQNYLLYACLLQLIYLRDRNVIFCIQTSERESDRTDLILNFCKLKEMEKRVDPQKDQGTAQNQDGGSLALCGVDVKHCVLSFRV